MTIQSLPAPTLPSLPVVGNLLQFRRDRLAFLQALSAASGDLGRFNLGSYPVLFVNSAELSHMVLVEQAANVEKSLMLRKFLRPLLGDGLLTSANATNRRQRRLMAPLFTPRHSATYAATIIAATEALQAQWQHQSTVETAPAMMRLTLGVISQALFSTDVSDSAPMVAKALRTALDYGSASADKLVNIPYHWPTPTHRRVARAITQLDGFIEAQIATRRLQTDHPGADLLGLLLRAQHEEDGAAMSATQVRDELMTLFLAGQETTANALTWSLYLLASHPAAYDRLRDEAQTVLGGRPPTLEDLPKLPFALWVFQESMRLYPPAYMIARKASRPFTLAGCHVPEELAIIISPYTLHRRPEYFAEPEAFRPERFDPAQSATFSRAAYMPFSVGPRNCLGNHLALLEGQLVLATLAQRVRFALPPGLAVRPDPAITLRPHGPVPLIAHRL